MAFCGAATARSSTSAGRDRWCCTPRAAARAPPRDGKGRSRSSSRMRSSPPRRRPSRTRASGAGGGRSRVPRADSRRAEARSGSTPWQGPRSKRRTGTAKSAAAPGHPACSHEGMAETDRLMRRALLIAAIACAGCHSPRATPTGRATLTSASAPAASPPSVALPDVATLTAKASPSVVNITATQQVRAPAGLVDPFEFFFGGRSPRGRGDEILRRHALGSGILVDEAGHVVTNAHVVENANAVRVTLADERAFDAIVKGGDALLDVAVLELKGAQDLTHAPLGSSRASATTSSRSAIRSAWETPSRWGSSARRGASSAQGRTTTSSRRMRRSTRQQRRSAVRSPRTGGRDQHRDRPRRSGHRVRDPDRRGEGDPPAAPREGIRRARPSRRGHPEHRRGDREGPRAPEAAGRARRRGRARRAGGEGGDRARTASLSVASIRRAPLRRSSDLATSSSR